MDIPKISTYSNTSTKYIAEHFGEGILNKSKHNFKSNLFFNAPVRTLAVDTMEIQTMSLRRIVDIYIVDTNESVPLESAILYNSEGIFTEQTDQELYLSLDVMGLLTIHNEKRVTFEDKDSLKPNAKLPPARISDLNMVVSERAVFT